MDQSQQLQQYDDQIKQDTEVGAWVGCLEREWEGGRVLRVVGGCGALLHVRPKGTREGVLLILAVGPSLPLGAVPVLRSPTELSVWADGWQTGGTGDAVAPHHHTLVLHEHPAHPTPSSPMRQPLQRLAQCTAQLAAAKKDHAAVERQMNQLDKACQAAVVKKVRARVGSGCAARCGGGGPCCCPCACSKQLMGRSRHWHPLQSHPAARTLPPLHRTPR